VKVSLGAVTQRYPRVAKAQGSAAALRAHFSLGTTADTTCAIPPRPNLRRHRRWGLIGADAARSPYSVREAKRRASFLGLISIPANTLNDLASR
jgi:hypothetical protein